MDNPQPLELPVTDAVGRVTNYFSELQAQICAALEQADGKAKFSLEVIEPPQGGLARPRVLADGEHIEKAAVQYTHSVGAALPPAATQRNPHLAGSPFQAAAISLIVHPANPMVPTTHMNLRFFIVEAEVPVWYFGGGFDLTPYYANEADIVHWHSQAAAATQDHYADLKQACDEYFYLPHRQECRGVGGIFFDDWTEGGFATSEAFVQEVGNHFLPAYLPIFERNKNLPFSEAQRDFQLYRRGRYAEFNLAFDRGTQYGLQSGRRVESVLASLPPLVRWEYNFVPEPGSEEEKLTHYYLKPRDWLATVS